jgi:4-hydroxyphenylpyruvate dioxygenase
VRRQESLCRQCCLTCLLPRLIESILSFNYNHKRKRNWNGKSTKMLTYRPAIFSASLGRASHHDFDKKIKLAAEYGFESIELFYEDLEQVAKKLAGINESPSETQLLNGATHIKALCDTLNLTVLGLQPFYQYEGLLDREEHERHMIKLKLWFRLAHTLGTNTIQVPANFLPKEKISGDMDVIVADLRKLADLGQREDPPIRFVYESLCWSTYIDTWEKSWAVVKQIDRPNFGLCLDTFNIAGRVWADPTSVTGKTPNADADLAASLKRMVEEVDLEKVFYIQIVDAERLDKPLLKGHEWYVEGQPPRMSWSRNARTYMYEEDRGAYLPVEDVARVLIEGLGYKGYISMELFSRTMAEEGEGVSEEHARRGIESWKRFEHRLALNQPAIVPRV